MAMVTKKNWEAVQEIAIIVGMIGIQFLYTVNAVMLVYFMSLGFSSLTIIIFTSVATFLIVFPVAFCFERNKWPKNLSFKLIMQLLLLSFGGLALQYLLLKGMNLTSLAMGTAMPNLAPGLIFITAWIFGLEKVDLSNKHSKVKIIGTLLCIFGTITMSMMQSISAPETQNDTTLQLLSTPSGLTFDMNKILGCFYLVVSVFILSSNVILQAFILGEYPAPMSLGAITALFGALMTAGVQLLQGHQLKTNLLLVNFRYLIGYSVMAGALGGICLSFYGWALKKKGPVFVSMFSPIGTVCSVMFSVITLGQNFDAGSLAGMFCMFFGLYLVLWAKGKEGYEDGDRLESESGVHRPLLS